MTHCSAALSAWADPTVLVDPAAPQLSVLSDPTAPIIPAARHPTGYTSLAVQQSLASADPTSSWPCCSAGFDLGCHTALVAPIACQSLAYMTVTALRPSASAIPTALMDPDARQPPTYTALAAQHPLASADHTSSWPCCSAGFGLGCRTALVTPIAYQSLTYMTVAAPRLLASSTLTALVAPDARRPLVYKALAALHISTSADPTTLVVPLFSTSRLRPTPRAV